MRDLKKLGDSDYAQHSQRFFKTGKGQYGEGDKFLGIRVPSIRKQLKQYRDISLEQSCKLLQSPYHEARLMAVLLMVESFKRGDERQRKAIYQAYLKHTKYVNNWDIVDSSAHKIVGAYLADKDKAILYKLARSKLLWERRIAIISCFHDIGEGHFNDALALAEILIEDEHDLMHKAVGWVLREIGKRDITLEQHFLDQHYRLMPRTMLRYAIERFPEPLRKAYLLGKV